MWLQSPRTVHCKVATNISLILSRSNQLCVWCVENHPSQCMYARCRRERMHPPAIT